MLHSKIDDAAADTMIVAVRKVGVQATGVVQEANDTEMATDDDLSAMAAHGLDTATVTSPMSKCEGCEDVALQSVITTATAVFDAHEHNVAPQSADDLSAPASQSHLDCPHNSLNTLGACSTSVSDAATMTEQVEAKAAPSPVASTVDAAPEKVQPLPVFTIQKLQLEKVRLESQVNKS